VPYLSEASRSSCSHVRIDAVFLTYSSGGRGVGLLMSYYPILDRVPRGRDEGEPFQTWLRRHDEYAA
jgi:predicted dithiol-disulfide oxidoreductase (DUF899 family)